MILNLFCIDNVIKRKEDITAQQLGIWKEKLLNFFVLFDILSEHHGNEVKRNYCVGVVDNSGLDAVFGFVSVYCRLLLNRLDLNWGN